MKPVRVLVVDDSALTRKVLARGLARDPAIEVVATAADPFLARDEIVAREPDVMTLDLEMPRMDGLSFLRKLMPQHPMPVVIVSSLCQQGQQVTLEALRAGAVDFVLKPTPESGRGIEEMLDELREKVKIAAHTEPRVVEPSRAGVVEPPRSSALAAVRDWVVAIGSSTGGPEALREVIQRFPSDMPAAIVVQHMPAGFTRSLAQSLDAVAAVTVKEAESGDELRCGRVLVAPGGLQTRVVRTGEVYRVVCDPGAKVGGHAPSVDVMMKSVARHVGRQAVGVVLTGMGRDGAAGLLAMKSAGAATVGQDEATSLVYGMPKAAADCGAVDRVVPLQRVTATLVELLTERARETNPERGRARRSGDALAG